MPCAKQWLKTVSDLTRRHCTGFVEYEFLFPFNVHYINKIFHLYNSYIILCFINELYQFTNRTYEKYTVSVSKKMHCSFILVFYCGLVPVGFVPVSLGNYTMSQVPEKTLKNMVKWMAWIYHHTSDISATNPPLKYFSSRLAVVFAPSIDSWC